MSRYRYDIDASSPGLRWLRDKGTLVVGLLFVAAGLLFLVDEWLKINLAAYLWPFLIIAPGLALLAYALPQNGVEGVGLAIGGSMVTMLGIVLLVQSVTGLWATWAYAWALVAPMSVGLGFILYGRSKGDPGHVRAGSALVRVGLGLFIGFGLFFEALFDISGLALGHWLLPAGLIAIGVYLAWKAVRSQ